MKNKIMVKKKEEPKKLTKPFERSTAASVDTARMIQRDFGKLESDKDQSFVDILSKSATGFGYTAVGITDILDSYDPGEMPMGIINYWEAIADSMRYTNNKVKESVVRMKSTEYALGIYELVVNAIAQELGEKLFEDLENNHYNILNNLQRKIYDAVIYAYQATCCDFEIYNVVDEYHNSTECATTKGAKNDEVMQNMVLPVTIGSHNMAAQLAIAIFDELYSISCLMVMKCPDFLDEITPYISDILIKSIYVSYGHILDIGSTTMFRQAVPFTTGLKQCSIDI